MTRRYRSAVRVGETVRPCRGALPSMSATTDNVTIERPWPDFFTVDEAAHVLRIGRSSAYALARQFVVSGGEVGLPAVRIGRHLRVPSVRLDEWSGLRPAVTPKPSESARPIDRRR